MLEEVKTYIHRSLQVFIAALFEIVKKLRNNQMSSIGKMAKLGIVVPYPSQEMLLGVERKQTINTCQTP